jgi:hypothetical protein
MTRTPEPRRYRVYRTGAVYAALACLLGLSLRTFSGALGLDETTVDLIIITIVLGFVPVVIITWMIAPLPNETAERRYAQQLKNALASIKRLRAIPDKQTDSGQN